MNELRLHEVAMLHGLWLVPALGALMLYAARRRREALRRFVEAGLLARLGPTSQPIPGRRVLKSALALLALACLVVALARPAWDPVRREVEERGRDVVFLLDVSRSMLAEDLPPNRLERAKLAIFDAVDRLEGDRVALAVFAGATVVRCPLTLDYGFFRLVLDDVSPLSVARGGTLIGDALRKVLRDVFDGKRSTHRDIVLITDGEDHESFPVEAAAAAGELGVRLIAIGLGDERVGQRIPVPAQDAAAPGAAGRSFLRHQGREVWSRLDADTLRRMAAATPGGRYLNVARGAVDLGEVYRRLIAAAEDRETGTRTLERLEEKYQIFLAACLLLLALEMLLRERRRPPLRRGGAAGLLLAALLPAAAAAASVRGLVNEGNEAYRAEDYGEALRAYEEALQRDPGSPYAALNRANALYRGGDFTAASEAYSRAIRRSLERKLPALEAAGMHNLGNALFRQAEQSAGTDPRRALELLGQAAKSYGDALRTAGASPAAAHNLEITRRFMDQLRQQAQQQPQSGGRQGQDDPSPPHRDQSRQDALRRAAEEQEQLADRSEQLQQERNERSDPESREEQRQQAQQLADEQRGLGEQTGQLAAGGDPQSRGQLEEAARHQQQAQEELQQDRPGAAEQAQRQAAEALRQAAADAAAEEQETAAAPAAEGEPQQQPSQMAEHERDMTAEQILAKEKLDRRRRQAMQRVGAVPVERDW